MTRGRNALGKGLSALIPTPRAASDAPRGDYFMCPIGDVRPDPNQPRQRFDDDALDELVASIEEKGILQPIVVRHGDAGGYLVVAGERRLRAARKAGLSELPVLVKDVASAEAFELALIENIQREDLNPIEEASAYQRLLDDGGFTQAVLAKRLGKQRSTIANAIRLLKLDGPHQQLLIDRKLTAGHARCLLAVDDADARAQLAERIVDESLTVRDAERAAREAKEEEETSGARPAARRPKPPSAVQLYCDELASELAEALGLSVAIKARGRRGRLTIDFGSIDELRTLRDRLASGVAVPEAPTFA